jgi:hypothetical protein
MMDVVGVQTEGAVTAPVAAMAVAPRRTAERLANVWALIDELLLLACRGLPPPADPNRFVAAYKSVYELCSKASNAQHRALYDDVRDTLVACSTRFRAAAAVETALAHYTTFVAMVSAIVNYLERHWVKRVAEEDVAVVPIAELASTVWAETTAPDATTAPEQATDSHGASSAPKRRKIAPSPSPSPATGTGTMRLRTIDARGEATIAELPVAVANALFSVLSNLVNDLSIGEGEVETTVVPLDADACPTDVVLRLIRLGTAIVDGPDGGGCDLGSIDIAGAERLYYEHIDLVSSSVAELVALVRAANYLGSPVVVDVGCFALATTLAALSPTQANRMCVDWNCAAGQKADAVPGIPTSADGELGGGLPGAAADGGGAAAAAVDGGAAAVVDVAGVPFLTDDNVVTLVPLAAVRMMHGVQPFVAIGCISSLGHSVTQPAAVGATMDEIVREVGWLLLHVPVVHTRFLEMVRSLLGIRVEGLTSHILAKVIAYCEHHVDDAVAP